MPRRAGSRSRSAPSAHRMSLRDRREPFLEARGSKRPSRRNATDSGPWSTCRPSSTPRASASWDGAFVQADEFTDRRGKRQLLSGAEGIDSQAILQASDQDREAKRVQSRIQETRFVVKARDRLVVFCSDAFEFRENRGSYDRGSRSPRFGIEDFAHRPTLY